ncbi:MAG: toll/interleukin-1 receptor domain-containing protein, partial [Bacilli bacterium]|nr:toll/interleukin-1 receptor domain-containing protein [Bacilli bacterium]
MAENNKLMLEKTILDGKFIFVSYSHHDQEKVEQDVIALQKEGVRIWYDIHMNPTDDWEDIANSKIEHPNCIGVLFYNSEYSFASSACEKERIITINRKNSDNNFTYWFTNLNGSTSSILSKVGPILTSQSPDKLSLFYSQYITNLLTLFNDNLIYIHPDSVASTMLDEAKKFGAIDNEGKTLENLSETGRLTDEKVLFEFGSFIDKKINMPLEHQKSLERFKANDKEYISINNEVYSTRPLYWELLYTKDSKAVLLCSRVIAKSQGGEKVKEYLRSVFMTAFTKEESDVIDGEPRLLTLADIEKHKSVP